MGQILKGDKNTSEEYLQMPFGEQISLDVLRIASVYGFDLMQNLDYQNFISSKQKSSNDSDSDSEDSDNSLDSENDKKSSSDDSDFSESDSDKEEYKSQKI